MRKVFTLYDLCLNETGKLLKSTYFEEDLSCEGHGNPFCALASSVIDDLIVRVSRSSEAAPLKRSHLHLLLTSGRARNLMLDDIRAFPEDIESILKDISSSCHNLISIKVGDVVFLKRDRHPNKDAYLTADKSRDYLKEKKSISLALDALLDASRKLEYVESYMEFNIKALCNCVNLKTLALDFEIRNQHLYDFLEVDGQIAPNKVLSVFKVGRFQEISCVDVAVILKYCTELVEIKCDIGKSLEYLYVKHLQAGTLNHEALITCDSLRKCQLGEYPEYALVARVHLASLTCPNLKHIHMLIMDYRAFYALSEFQHLTSVVIEWGDRSFSCGDFQRISSLFEKPEFGRNLKSLHISVFYEVDLSLIGGSCPNLEELALETAIVVECSHFPPGFFQNLLKLHVKCTFGMLLDCDTYIGLLRNTTNLEHLTIEFATTFTDSVVDNILKNNGLSKLKVLRVSKCVLSIEGLRNLAAKPTSLEHFEMSSDVVSLEAAERAMLEVNPSIVTITHFRERPFEYFRL